MTKIPYSAPHMTYQEARELANISGCFMRVNE